MRYFLFIFLTAYSFTATAQDRNTIINTKKIEIVGNDIPLNSKAFFVAEIHGFNDLTDFEFKLMARLLTNYNVKHIVLERGNADAYLINQYIQKGDTAYRRYFSAPKTLEYFERYRALYKQHTFTVHGIDFERLEFVAAVQDILNKSEAAKHTALYKYVVAMGDSVTHINSGKKGYEQRIEIYEHAKSLFEQDKATLAPAVSDNYAMLEQIFTNPASERHISRRNGPMLINLGHIPGIDSEKFVCILGAAHNSLDNKASILSKYLDKHPTNTVIIQMVCKNCDISTYFGVNHVDISAQIDLPDKVQLLDAAYGPLYKPGFYSIIDQHSIKGLENNYNEQPTYYVLFKDQPSEK